MKHDKPKRFMDPEYRKHAPEMAVIFWMFLAIGLTVAAVIFSCAGFYWLSVVGNG